MNVVSESIHQGSQETRKQVECLAPQAEEIAEVESNKLPKPDKV